MCSLGKGGKYHINHMDNISRTFCRSHDSYSHRKFACMGTFCNLGNHINLDYYQHD